MTSGHVNRSGDGACAEAGTGRSAAGVCACDAAGTMTNAIPASRPVAHEWRR